MSLQGITVAISPTGISYFAHVLLSDQLAKAMQAMTVPDKTISLPEIMITSSKRSSTSADNVKIFLQSGAFLGFNPTFDSLVQGDDGQFTMTIIANNFTVKYIWNEQFDFVDCNQAGCVTASHRNDTYDYQVGIGTMTVVLDLKFVFVNNAFVLQVTNATATSSGVTPNIPKDSIVNLQQDSGCLSRTVSDTTVQALESIDFSDSINKVIPPALDSIPSTGQLTPNITFNFPLGPSGLTFPGDNGIAVGVTGDASFNGTEFPGPNPPQLALPPVPPDHHLNYFVSDYTFNSLFWAFFEEGDLAVKATTDNIPDPDDLNTKTYQNTTLQPLFDAFPFRAMSAEITPLVPPTVSFSKLFDLTAANLATLKPQLPPDVYSILLNLEGQVFVTQADFDLALQNTLGQVNFNQFQTIIEGVAHVVGALVTHSNQVIINVIDDGQTKPVITFKVEEVDVLQEFVLDVSGTTQTLQFQFQLIGSMTKAQFVSSIIQGIDSSDWNSVYFVIEPKFAQELAKKGQQGVALPRIKGFDFVFPNATIALQEGFASVLTDVQHTTDPGITYLVSKRPATASA